MTKQRPDKPFARDVLIRLSATEWKTFVKLNQELGFPNGMGDLVGTLVRDGIIEFRPPSRLRLTKPATVTTPQGAATS